MARICSQMYYFHCWTLSGSDPSRYAVVCCLSDAFLTPCAVGRGPGGRHNLQLAGRPQEEPRLLLPRVRDAQGGLAGQAAAEQRPHQGLELRRDRRLGRPAGGARPRDHGQGELSGTVRGDQPSWPWLTKILTIIWKCITMDETYLDWKPTDDCVLFGK